MTFGVKDKAALDEWVAHLDTQRIKHTPVVTGYIGHVIGIATPDGLALRVYTDEAAQTVVSPHSFIINSCKGRSHG